MKMPTFICSFFHIFIILQLNGWVNCEDYNVDLSAGLGREYDGIGGLSGGGLNTWVNSEDFNVDLSAGLGREYDGIGGLSAGATSKLLVNYAEPYRNEILDYLFKPYFAASLQIFKVEIGGDAESTDGTESSHMHESWDEGYDRGYEWWLMVEAKKRNPDIKLYGLPWAFPGWLGAGTGSPYHNPNFTASYILKWVQGAKKYYNLDIDYLGIWNERKYDVKYVKVLRKTLDNNGFSNIKLVVADGKFQVIKDIDRDPEFARSVDFIGVHYPGTNSTPEALKTKKPIWSSEDYSTFNDGVGAGCWARILNQNYVNGYMTSTISWNLIASYYQSLPFGRDGLMTAQEPWSGHYVVQSPIWVTAHTTQFTSIGWYYLKHGSGVGKLTKGGSYVSFVSSKSDQFTMVIETMSHDHSKCIRPALPAYSTAPQNVTFHLKGDLAQIPKLFVWYSKLHFDGKPDVMFQPLKDIQVNSGHFTLELGVDELYTLTTIYRAHLKPYPSPPPSQAFPLPYTDNFDAYPLNSEAFNFVPQTGVWEVRRSEDKAHGQVNRQVVLTDPCYWCKSSRVPINIGGNHKWADIFVQMDVKIPVVNGTKGVFVGARIGGGGCKAGGSRGIYFHIQQSSNNFTVSTDVGLKKILDQGQMKTVVTSDVWYHLGLMIRGNKAYGYLGVDQVFQINIPAKPSHGFVGYGASTYGLADYDNFQIQDAGN